MDRRTFLRSSLALGCSAAASPLATPMAFAEVPGDRRLVVILLRGAMDGLDVIRPVASPEWRAARPSLAADAGAGADLGGGFALHPALGALAPLWQAGQMGAVHAVSTPYRDKRSHFDGQDMLEAGLGSLEEGLRDGWLNRLVGQIPGARADLAYAIGRERMLILDGAAPHASWSPEVSLLLTPQGQRLLEQLCERDPLFGAALEEAMAVAGSLPEAELAGRADHERLADFAAERLTGAARIASFSLNGWDTHARQDVALKSALSRLAETVLALRGGLGPAWERTAVVCLTEFGRTFRENGTGGTDHGTGGAALLFGGAIRGGRVISDWPGLGEGDLYAGRDLLPTRDVRAHLGWMLSGLFGLSRTALEQVVFPGLDLGADPGLLA
ncbi:DUF1501 domain-containing protein [Pseudoroseicyclus tamaricis]|uniref:DUF1501 domain-containing protein n=1 Tax=Pseudoroseicyclus tamaricis TaxID=2705421 RepID=A0A6B2JUQ6_9RHOB|nr:DUF1501 domain-containing protein [Pseudoroseicyclus tamaricis]NDU99913.1 DUF1501 domain-containing protein [Pseudoroseicyclus tamaricis]